MSFPKCVATLAQSKCLDEIIRAPLAYGSQLLGRLRKPPCKGNVGTYNTNVKLVSSTTTWQVFKMKYRNMFVETE